MRLIKNEKKFRQRLYWGDLDFDGLSFTDIDAYMNYFEKILIFIEVKQSGKKLGFAQKRAFETIIKNLNIPSVYILAWHEDVAEDQNILLRDCFVREYFYKNRWVNGNKQYIEPFVKKIINSVKSS